MCVNQLTIINPHYVKLAKENRVNIRVFDQEEDYRLHVPCGHCDECLRKRQQNWFLRANHIMQRLRLDPKKCLFCVSIRFTTYFLEVFENIWDKIWRN